MGGEASWSMDKQPQDSLSRQVLKFTGTFQTINSSTVKLICEHGGEGGPHPTKYWSATWPEVSGMSTVCYSLGLP